VIQAVLTLTVTETSGNGAFTWDKYTSAGWVAAILGLINVVIMLPCVFQVSTGGYRHIAYRCFVYQRRIYKRLAH
jgi:hypothetical protein